MTLELPKTFTITKVSPTIGELNFIYDWLKNNINQKVNVLEFGAGPSTWAITSALEVDQYVLIEHWAPSINDVLNHLNNIKIIKGLWYDIPENIKYDVVFVDSSAGYPPSNKGLHRDEAVKYSERLLSDNGYIILHDWHKRSGSAPKKYIENTNNYKLVASFRGRTGVGIYKCI